MTDRYDDTRAWVADLVRSGLATRAQVEHQVVEAIAQDHPVLDAHATATEWISEAGASWTLDALTWPEVTDFDRLQQVFAALAAADVVVLQGCADHWAARDELSRRTPRGVAWFTPPDVWHAIDEGMLEVNLWHGTAANAAPGDDLLEEVLAMFREAGLAAKFDEGRIEVSAYWQRHPSR